jgi:ubiquinone/menaquinone biosynthesis C-methylase UbiE
VNINNIKNETDVSAAFSAQSPVFDATYNGNQTTLWMRSRARKEVMTYIKPGARILELNCGTGIDSLYFAEQGFEVVATDNSDGMLAKLRQKISSMNTEPDISVKKCSFNRIDTLDAGTFDYVFSNFGGLNCTDKLYEVLEGIDKVLKPGGHFTLVVMPKICPWEILMLFKGYFKTAFRRFKKNGTPARIEGVHFMCYYYNPFYIIKHVGEKYKLKALKGLCIVMPPPFIEKFHERYPRIFGILEQVENRISLIPPFNRWCDHYAITMQKIK